VNLDVYLWVFPQRNGLYFGAHHKTLGCLCKWDKIDTELV
jgi:hypothetical protein